MLTFRPGLRDAAPTLAPPPQQVTFGGGVFSVLLSQMERVAQDAKDGTTSKAGHTNGHITLKVPYAIAGAPKSAADQAVVAKLRGYEQKILDRYAIISAQNLVQYNKVIDTIATMPGVINPQALPPGVIVSPRPGMVTGGPFCGMTPCSLLLPTNGVGVKSIPPSWQGPAFSTMYANATTNTGIVDHDLYVLLPWYVNPHKQSQQVKPADFVAKPTGGLLPGPAGAQPLPLTFSPVVNGQYPMWIIDPPPSVKAIYNRQWMLFIKNEGNHVYSFDLTMKPKEFDLVAWIESAIEWVLQLACGLITGSDLQTASTVAATVPDPTVRSIAAAWQSAAAACGLVFPPPSAAPPAPTTLAPPPPVATPTFWDQYQKPLVIGGAVLVGLIALKAYRDRHS